MIELFILILKLDRAKLGCQIEPWAQDVSLHSGVITVTSTCKSKNENRTVPIVYLEASAIQKIHKPLISIIAKKP